MSTPSPPPSDRRRTSVDTVALVLAIGVVAVLMLVALSSVLNVWLGRNPTPSLGENTTQVLTSVGGGIIGVLGSYIGYYARRREDGED
jgi:amino acid transporter